MCKWMAREAIEKASGESEVNVRSTSTDARVLYRVVVEMTPRKHKGGLNLKY